MRCDARVEEGGKLLYVPYEGLERVVEQGEHGGWSALHAWDGVLESVEWAEVFALGVLL